MSFAHIQEVLAHLKKKNLNKKTHFWPSWILKWETYSLAKCWTETTLHVANTRCNNPLFAKAIAVRSKETKKWNPNPTRVDYPTWEQATSQVLYCLVSYFHDHMLGYIQEAKTSKEAWKSSRRFSRCRGRCGSCGEVTGTKVKGSWRNFYKACAQMLGTLRIRRINDLWERDEHR